MVGQRLHSENITIETKIVDGTHHLSTSLALIQNSNDLVDGEEFALHEFVLIRCERKCEMNQAVSLKIMLIFASMLSAMLDSSSP